MAVTHTKEVRTEVYCRQYTEIVMVRDFGWRASFHGCCCWAYAGNRGGQSIKNVLGARQGKNNVGRR